jgi:hypothetical protein
MTETEKLLLLRVYRDAAAKVAELPDRFKDEDQQSEAEKRQPYPITPYTALTADVVVKICAAIPQPIPDDIKPIWTVQRNACKALGSEPVYLLSEQVLALLKAAGIGETNAQVQG